MKIVIIEDMYYRDDIQNILIQAKHEVLITNVAASLKDVIREIQEFNPDLILLDHGLSNVFTGEDIHFKTLAYPKLGISIDYQRYVKFSWTEKSVLSQNRHDPKTFKVIGNRLLKAVAATSKK